MHFIIVIDENINHSTSEVFAHYVLGIDTASQQAISTIVLDSYNDVLKLIRS